tara:strand:- start:115 stop:690 length:576 start_codon:yes stop_codon:yes gene_type:complete
MAVTVKGTEGVSKVEATGTASSSTFLRGDYAWAEAGGGKIAQILSTTKTDTFSTTSATFVDIPSMTVTITPAAASSKIYIMASMNGGGQQGWRLQLVRDSTAISIGDTASSRTPTTATGSPKNGGAMNTASFNFLDSPSTTSATTYKIQVSAESDQYGATNQGGINRSYDDADGSWQSRATSTITVMEVSA